MPKAVEVAGFIVNDTVMGGRSDSELVMSDQAQALFCIEVLLSNNQACTLSCNSRPSPRRLTEAIHNDFSLSSERKRIVPEGAVFRGTVTKRGGGGFASVRFQPRDRRVFLGPRPRPTYVRF